MDQFKKSTLKTSRGLTYTYYHYPGKDVTKPTIVLHHGWPDDAHLYEGVVGHIIPTGHGMIIPDLLGYGDTDKPTDKQLYNSKDMAQDIIEILDHEKVVSFISLGHDLGSYMAQRMYYWHPSRVVALILLSVVFMPPHDEPFNLDAVNAMLESATGFPRYSYWEFFTSPDANDVVQAHLDSFWCSLHAKDPDHARRTFCMKGATRKFLEEDTIVELKPFAQDEAKKKAFLARIQRDGLVGAFNWYHAMVDNIQSEVEKEIDRSLNVLKIPHLFIGCDEDAICLTAYFDQGQKAGLYKDATKKEINSGHWCTLEKPDEVGLIIKEWLEERQIKA
ncbi:alpha/beta-hydrolase [Pseudovirgaria hyperparasitica]|uniref:Alpha/beta-hydrolase n=1 Tax=Pseudovirgaria hyperparasitica TaxID=470096 RepID=A0A6A6VVL8_9PEZI|nr:alpha/beta-hydrolase [Pseudovirgaria hyperparasitica]KAF2753836.1 alpha/beta-hydrolase [Pseudovirgaria hyperparasitica]